MADLALADGDAVAVSQLYDVPEAHAVVVRCTGAAAAPPAVVQRAVWRHFGVAGSGGGSSGTTAGGTNVASMLAVARAVVDGGIGAAEEALIRAQAARCECRFLPVVAGQSLRVELPSGAYASVAVSQTAPRHSTVIVGPTCDVTLHVEV